MTPYLFLWNPKMDPDSFVEYEKVQSNAKNGIPYQSTWICPSKQPQPNDIAIVQRTGSKNNGIFAKGTVTYGQYEDEDGTRIIEFELDSFLPLGKEIPRKEIVEHAGYEKNWQPMASGNIIPEPLYNAILELWENRDPNISDDKKLTTENVSDDISEILTKYSSTERDALISARIGQGDFRLSLIKKWNGHCAVTGCSQLELLRASHCKPWRLSNNNERLDPDNGILLSANYDAAFDAGLISFSDDGEVLISPNLNDSAKNLLKLENVRIQLNERQKNFLKFHRDTIFARA